MGSGVTVLILLIKWVIGAKMSAGWHYSLWFFLVVKLVVPDAPVSSFSIFSILYRLLGVIVRLSPAHPTAANVAPYFKMNRANLPDFNPAGDYAVSVAKIDFPTLFFLIWLAGVAVTVVYLIWRNRRTAELLRNKQPVNAEPVLQLLTSCQRKMGIRAEIRLYEAPHLQIPVLYGILSPQLLLPGDIAGLITTEQLKHVFLHELAHWKRKDGIMNFVVCILQVIHWFNPVIGYAFGRMRREREAACDSTALSYLRENEYYGYGETFISFLGKRVTTGTIAFLADKRDIRRRVANIARFRRPSPGKRVLAGALFILIGCLGLTNATGLPGNDWRRQTLRNATPLDLQGYFHGYDGGFVLLDQEKNRYLVYNESKIRERVSPDSTFKIYAALMGLENKTLHDENTRLPWDGRLYPFPVWNRDQTLRSAMAYSVNWYFERVIANLGPDQIRRGLARIGYGNCDMSGGADFWLESSLKIAPLEQVEALQEFYTYRLPFARKNVDTVKRVIQLAAGGDSVLAGKTGTGTVNRQDVRGWFVGYLVKHERPYFFATHLQGEAGANGKKAKEITLAILKDQQLL